MSRSKLAIVAVAALTIVGAIFVVLSVSQHGGDPSRASGVPAISVAATDYPPVRDFTATPSPIPFANIPPTPTPRAGYPSVGAPTRLSIPRDGSVGQGYGLVSGNSLTGGAELWLLPENTGPTGLSRSGRYFGWGDSIYDGWTGERAVVAHEALAFVVFSPDEEQAYVQTIGGAGSVVRRDGSEIARLPGRTAPPGGESTPRVSWNSDGRAVAVTRGPGPGPGSATAGGGTDVVLDGVLQPPIASAGIAVWAHTGLRLAVMGPNPAIHNYASRSLLPLQRGGTALSWSPDDRYLGVAIPSADGEAAVSAIDAETGIDVLHVHPAAGCSYFFTTFPSTSSVEWAGPSLLGTIFDKGVSVPSGQLLPFPARLAPPPSQLVFDPGGVTRWLDESGVYASVAVRGTWSPAGGWLLTDRGSSSSGKDYCSGPLQEPVVDKPPYTVGVG